MAKQDYPPGTKVWVRSGSFRHPFEEVPATVIGKTRGDKYIFRHWSRRLKRYVKYTAWPWHIIRKRD